MAGRKHEVFDKVEPFNIQPSPYNFSAVSLAELTEVVCIDDHFLQLPHPHHTTLQPAKHDPPLNLLNPNVQRLSKRVLGEPVLTHLGAGAEPVQHGPDGRRRPSHRNGNFWQRLGGD